MKYIFLLFCLFNFILIGKSQEIDFPYYKGGAKSLKEDFGYFLSSQSKFNDTALFFFAEITFKKSIDSIQFAYFDLANMTNFVENLHPFFSNKNERWQRSKMNDSTTIIIPIVIFPLCKLDSWPNLNSRDLSTSKMPKSKKAIFFEPLVVKLMCVEPCRN